MLPGKIGSVCTLTRDILLMSLEKISTTEHLSSTLPRVFYAQNLAPRFNYWNY